MTVLDDQKAFAPLLPVGFHPADLVALRRLCVDYFPASVSRPRLMETITTIVGLINRASIPARLWIDGSFLTEKQNPPDCDITLVLVESVYHSFSADQHEFFEWFRRVSLFSEYKCNNYAIVVDAERDDWELVYTYWLRQYGFDREKRKKGVVEILVPFLESV